MTKQQRVDSAVLAGSRVDSDPKEGIQRLIKQMNDFDGSYEKNGHVKCEWTVHHVPTQPTVDTVRLELQEDNSKIREEMELVAAKLEHETECRKNALYELESLVLQLNKSHSDLQRMTMFHNSLQASTKALRRQKCYLVGLFEDLKHRHGELKQDFEVVSVQHDRTRAMLERALQERDYWETRCKSTMQWTNDEHHTQNGGKNCPSNSKEGPKSILAPSNSTQMKKTVKGIMKRTRCDYEDVQDRAEKSIMSKKQFRCATQALDFRGAPEQSISILSRHETK
ncbi:MAG: hypothetical protein SGBAC_005426 [Bacillariaceae sp.]